MTTAPPEAQRRLLEVQALDTRLDQIAHRRANVPALARLVELDSQLADLETALVTSRTAANDLRRAVAKAESDVEQVRTRATRDQTRLDSGSGSPKDLQAFLSTYGARPFESVPGLATRDYAAIPTDMLGDTRTLQIWFKLAHGYVSRMPPNPTRRS